MAATITPAECDDLVRELNQAENPGRARTALETLLREFEGWLLDLILADWRVRSVCGARDLRARTEREALAREILSDVYVRLWDRFSKFSARGKAAFQGGCDGLRWYTRRSVHYAILDWLRLGQAFSTESLGELQDGQAAVSLRDELEIAEELDRERRIRRGAAAECVREADARFPDQAYWQIARLQIADWTLRAVADLRRRRNLERYSVSDAKAHALLGDETLELCEAFELALPQLDAWQVAYGDRITQQHKGEELGRLQGEGHDVDQSTVSLRLNRLWRLVWECLARKNLADSVRTPAKRSLPV